jgi:hypothetical protein
MFCTTSQLETVSQILAYSVRWDTGHDEDRAEGTARLGLGVPSGHA